MDIVNCSLLVAEPKGVVNRASIQRGGVGGQRVHHPVGLGGAVTRRANEEPIRQHIRTRPVRDGQPIGHQFSIHIKRAIGGGVGQRQQVPPVGRPVNRGGEVIALRAVVRLS